jgi:hypothetical protein
MRQPRRPGEAAPDFREDEGGRRALAERRGGESGPLPPPPSQNEI